MTEWQPYLLAIAVGALIGIEREKSHPQEKILGLRTFILLGLLGAAARGFEHSPLSFLISLFSLGLVWLGYFTQTKKKRSSVDLGLTTELAAGVVFCVGYAAKENPTWAALVGVLTALLLFSKRKLHSFTRHIKPVELESAILLFLIALVVIQLVPDEPIDRWKILQPKKFGYIIVTLASFEFASYILGKIFGGKKGSLLSGFLGGLVSSTTVVLSSAQHSQKNPRESLSYLPVALAANLASVAELLVIIPVVSWPLFLKVIPEGGVILFLGMVEWLLLIKFIRPKDSAIDLKSPLNWRGVLRLSLFLGAILAAIAAAQNLLGDQATTGVSFLTGLFELHGVALANATLNAQGRLSESAAHQNVLMALGASFCAKATLGLIVGRGAFRWAFALSLLPLLIPVILFWIIGPIF